MLGLLEGEDRAPEAIKSTTTLRDGQVEVGKYFNRCHDGTTKDISRI